MSNTQSINRVSPWIALGGVSLIAAVPSWLKFRASPVSFFSFNRAAIPLQISTSGMLFATGGLVAVKAKRITFECSLAYTDRTTKQKGHNWWNSVNRHENLLVGAIPLADRKHLSQLQDEGVSAVLICLEPFELGAGWVHTPVTCEEWSQAGVEVKQIAAQDFLPVPPEQIRDGVAFIKEQIDAGKKVYVHCKAGRGRSATMVIAYLMTHHNMSRDDAFDLVEGSRPQIHLNPLQLKALDTYHKSL